MTDQMQAKWWKVDARREVIDLLVPDEEFKKPVDYSHSVFPCALAVITAIVVAAGLASALVYVSPCNPEVHVDFFRSFERGKECSDWFGKRKGELCNATPLSTFTFAARSPRGSGCRCSNARSVYANPCCFDFERDAQFFLPGADSGLEPITFDNLECILAKAGNFDDPLCYPLGYKSDRDHEMDFGDLDVTLEVFTPQTLRENLSQNHGSNYWVRTIFQFGVLEPRAPVCVNMSAAQDTSLSPVLAEDDFGGGVESIVAIVGGELEASVIEGCNFAEQASQCNGDEFWSDLVLFNGNRSLSAEAECVVRALNAHTRRNPLFDQVTTMYSDTVLYALESCESRLTRALTAFNTITGTLLGGLLLLMRRIVARSKAVIEDGPSTKKLLKTVARKRKASTFEVEMQPLGKSAHDPTTHKHKRETSCSMSSTRVEHPIAHEHSSTEGTDLALQEHKAPEKPEYDSHALPPSRKLRRQSGSNPLPNFRPSMEDEHDPVHSEVEFDNAAVCGRASSDFEITNHENAQYLSNVVQTQPKLAREIGCNNLLKAPSLSYEAESRDVESAANAQDSVPSKAKP